MRKFTSEDDETRTASDALSVPLTAQALEKTQISKYHTKGGHGFAAEDANNLADTLRGKTAQVVGTSNESNGADRTVNGIRLQSKYFQSASGTVEAAFDPSSGYYRYEGQVLEVPRDQYEECLGFMRKRIAQGKVPGHENPGRRREDRSAGRSNLQAGEEHRTRRECRFPALRRKDASCHLHLRLRHFVRGDLRAEPLAWREHAGRDNGSLRIRDQGRRHHVHHRRRKRTVVAHKGRRHRSGPSSQWSQGYIGNTRRT